jgi:VIT1/CCC1 family predicted Fe2+/Mn2+ transporter
LLISNPEHGLDTLAREELGINPAEISSPWGAAFSSFFSFTIGAFIPLVPFLFGHHSWNIELAIILTAVALYSIGAMMNLFTNTGVLKSGFRMLLVGSLAGAITFLTGKLLGVSLH